MTPQVQWWGMMPGNGHIADALFTSASVLAMDYLNDPDEGDLSDLVGADVEQVHERFKQSLMRHPDPRVKDTRYHAGNIYRFLTELGVGDIVVFRTLLPEETRGTVHVDRVVGGYAYRPRAVQGFVHQYPTKPIKTLAGSELPARVLQSRHTIWKLGDEARTVIERLIADVQ